MASTSPHSDTFSSMATTSITQNSGSYADIESASNVRLLQNGSSASVILQGRKSSWITTITVASLVISSLCLIGLGLFGYWFFVLNDGELMPHALDRGSRKDAEVCLPCVQIGPNPLDSSPSTLWGNLDVKYDEENSTEICCASTSAQFAALFKLILQRQQAVKKLADSLEKNKVKKGEGKDVSDDVSGEVTKTGPSAVSAHLVYKPRKRTRNSDGGAEVTREQQWKSPSESPMSHVREGLQFQDKRILIQTPGLYYVYCQILYSPSLSSSPSSDVTAHHDVASAYVRRYSILRPAAPDFLLKSRHTRHDVKEDRHSSYVGGVFRLHSGDSLYVQVSRPDLISYDDVGSFFGLFRIGD